jgi:ATP-dependent Clp protease, protease subunit
VPIPKVTHHPAPPFPATPPVPPGRPALPPAQPPAPSVGGPILYATGPAAAGSGIDPVLDRLLEERIVFLGREVDDDIANRISAQLLLLAAQDPERDSPCTSTRPAARSQRAWPSTTRCG